MGTTPHPKASGLQSLVWRYRWDKSLDYEYQKLLLSYNKEDCKALYLLTEELSKITETADSKWNVDFADRPKKHSTVIGSQIHKDLEMLLRSAHADYKKNRIISREEIDIKTGSDASHNKIKGINM